MDILSQALNVAEQAEAAGGAATLTFDLRKESHRAAYAAALAVLRIGGVDEEELVEGAAGAEGGAVVSAGGGAVPIVTLGSGDEVQPAEQGGSAYEKELRQRYGEAMTDLTPDEATRGRAARETFPRVVELLKDGANVEAVAQIQYRRWVEDNIDTVRG